MADVDLDDYGRPETPLAGNEVDTLLGFLDYQRATLAWKCAGLEAGDAALDATHPARDGQGRPSLRWVLVHMIEEYARHNGHADLLRESIDGQTGE